MFWDYLPIAFKVVKMAGIGLAILITLIAGIAFFCGHPALNEEKVIYPWEKEERRAAKKAAKAEARARREFWK